jgi:hypothetical protein
MSFEDVAIIVSCATLLFTGIMLIPRVRRGELLERPQAQRLEFDPLLVDSDGPVLDLEPA